MDQASNFGTSMSSSSSGLCDSTSHVAPMVLSACSLVKPQLISDITSAAESAPQPLMSDAPARISVPIRSLASCRMSRSPMFPRPPRLKHVVQLKPAGALLDHAGLAEVGAAGDAAVLAHDIDRLILAADHQRAAEGVLGQERPEHGLLAADARLILRAQRAPLVAVSRPVIDRALVVVDLDQHAGKARPHCSP